MQDLERGDESVACGAEIAEDQVPTLFAAQVVAVAEHLIDHVFIADGGPELARRLLLYEQMKLVTYRMNVSLYRNVEYINNKFMLHIGSALFNSFTFWMISDTVDNLQLRLQTLIDKASRER